MRLAFVGGNGHHYLRGALTDPLLTVESPVAVASDGYDEPAARALAAQIPNCQWFDSVDALLDQRVQPDFVSVGAMYGHNGDVLAKVLARGIGAATDKPAAATWEQLGQLQAVTTNSPAVLVTEFNYRGDQAFQAARHVVQAGMIGEVVLVTCQKSYRFGTRPAWYARRADYGGTLLWVASHGVDWVRFTTGLSFTTVTGKQGNVSKPDYGTMEDHTVSVFGLSNGATAVVHADYLRPTKAASHGDDRLRIAGSLGVVEVLNSRCTLVTHDQEERDVTGLVPPPLPVHQLLLAGLRKESTDLYGTQSSLEMAQVLLHARDAADTGGVVTISARNQVGRILAKGQT